MEFVPWSLLDFLSLFFFLFIYWFCMNHPFIHAYCIHVSIWCFGLMWVPDFCVFFFFYFFFARPICIWFIYYTNILRTLFLLFFFSLCGMFFFSTEFVQVPKTHMIRIGLLLWTLPCASCINPMWIDLLFVVSSFSAIEISISIHGLCVAHVHGCWIFPLPIFGVLFNFPDFVNLHAVPQSNTWVFVLVSCIDCAIFLKPKSHCYRLHATDDSGTTRTRL